MDKMLTKLETQALDLYAKVLAIDFCKCRSLSLGYPWKYIYHLVACNLYKCKQKFNLQAKVAALTTVAQLF